LALIQSDDRKRTIAVFATWSYRQILQNWIEAAPQSIKRQLVIHAYGTVFPLLLRLLGHRVSVVSIFRPTKSKIWRDRVKTTLNYLELGVELIICDADAVVLEDFTAEIDSIPGNVVASQGLGHPKAVFQSWDGFTLCCGFAIYRANETTIVLMKRVLDYEGSNEFDDQTALNSVLMNNNLIWEKPQANYFLEDEKRRIRCFPGILSGTVMEGDLSGLGVVLLPHSIYRRLPNSTESISPKVFHPIPGSRKRKENNIALKENGLWRL
jgi:hypothetical protein